MPDKITSKVILALLALGLSSPALASTLPITTTLNVVVKVSGDYYNGNPHLGILVDGKQLATDAVTATHSSNQWQTLSYQLTTTSLPKTFSVSFLDDAWGGAHLDRNLYLQSVTLNNKNLPLQQATYHNSIGQTGMYWGGPMTWDVSSLFVTAVNGTCGTSNNAASANAPTANLCGTGTASSVTNTGKWAWTCVGSGSGSTASCSAPLSVLPKSCLDAKGTSHISGSTYTLTLSQITGLIPAPAGQCPYGGTQTGTVTQTQTYLCANGTITPQGATVTTTTNIGNLSCNPPPPVSGACGSSNGVGTASAPTSNFCLSGTSSAISGQGPWSWSCAGSNGGANAQCSAPKKADGVCGSAKGVASIAAPASGLCSTGTASTVTATTTTGQSTWSWSCAGLNFGASASCTAPTLTASSGPAVGVNLSGNEYSWETYAAPSHLDYLKKKGVTLVRVPIAWEKLQPVLNGDLSPTELAKLNTFLDLVAAHNMKAVVDIHNGGRYNVAYAKEAAAHYNIISASASASTTYVLGTAQVPISAFKDLWIRLATALHGRSGISGYDIMNEPNTMPSPTIWPMAAQAAVDGIRTVDKTTLIYVEGDGWATAVNWVYNNPNLHITDPSNNFVYEAHQYFDNNSGTYTSTYDQYGNTPLTGVKKVQPFLDWLKKNNAKGYIGEFGIPTNDPRWLVLVENFLDVLKQNNVPATAWSYTYPDPTGANTNWWPMASDPMKLMPNADGTDQPAWSVLTKYTLGK
jgi:hypothetical protein